MMSFYFYDLETSGLNPKSQRIMQFAGQRTDMDLNPIGEPDDILIKLDKDVLPDPDAVLVTGITPQRTHLEGISEVEFCHYFFDEIAIPDTIFIGFNTIRFDDEFMRYLLYRNLYDPYEWQWKEGRSRWDLLDVVRMTRALRPDGIEWPVSEDGKAINRLELITAANNLEHTHAHNALSDVMGSIGVARLIKEKQPKLFSYLLSIRGKNDIENLFSTGQPLVYSSGSLETEFEKTTVVFPLGPGPEKGTTVVYDLRYSPAEFLNASLADDDRQPMKVVKHNKCPALAPLSVVDESSWKRLGLSKVEVLKNWEEARLNADKLYKAYTPREFPKEPNEVTLETVDGLLYKDFFGDSDKKITDRIHKLTPEEMVEFEPIFVDARLAELFFLLRARQYPKLLLADDRARWEDYVHKKLLESEPPLYATYMNKLNELAKADYLDADKRYVLEELALYGQSIVPLDSF